MHPWTSTSNILRAPLPKYWNKLSAMNRFRSWKSWRTKHSIFQGYNKYSLKCTRLKEKQKSCSFSNKFNSIKMKTNQELVFKEKTSQIKNRNMLFKDNVRNAKSIEKLSKVMMKNNRKYNPKCNQIHKIFRNCWHWADKIKFLQNSWER